MHRTDLALALEAWADRLVAQRVSDQQTGGNGTVELSHASAAELEDLIRRAARLVDDD